MAPARPLKRQKTNPDEPPQVQRPPEPSQVPLPPDTPQSETPQSPAQDSNRQSWYNSWRGKAAPVTQVARETISKATDATSETASILSDKIGERRASVRSPSLAMTLGKAASNRSLPIDATTSKIYATPEAASPSRKGSLQTPLPKSPSKDRALTSKTEEQSKTSTEEAANGKVNTAQPPPRVAELGPKSDDAQGKDSSQATWFPWLSKAPEVSNASGPETPRPGNTAAPIKPDNIVKPTEQISKLSEPTQSDGSPPQGISNKRTWLQMWSDDPTKQDGQPDTSKAAPTPATKKPDQTKSLDIPKPETPAKTTSQASSIEISPPPALPGDPTKSSGWIFWSRDKKGTNADSREDQPHLGELAISDTPSQSRPKRASISMPREDRPDVKVAAQTDPSKKAPAKTELAKAGGERPTTPLSMKMGDPKLDSKVPKAHSANATAAVKAPTVTIPNRTASPAPSVKAIDNLLLPSFTSTLKLPENPSILQQLARLLYFTKEPVFKHLSLVKDPPRIRNALAIGVHGYFPGTMVRTLLGQPTGTSIKFADMAAKSIRKWTRAHGYDCQVKTAALEGEGKIAERVELLWKLLLNWIEEIRKSDFVMVACHSQGVPVAVMLVSKLIQFGCISAARVGVCAMAGVNLGPFPELKSRWITGSAGELFEFSNPDSRVSTEYTNALEILLRAGVRLTLVGSIDDQLVSLESSIFSPITHPHIYRAVSIDSRIHAPNFLSHLVGFVLKLRNLGIQDHGLIRELSSPLAGSLYTGEGHSRIYDDDAVYDLAVSFALETSALTNVPLSRRSNMPAGGNPYVLPFAMRGVLEEDFVKTELQEEAQQLLREFDDWRPTTKTLKDVKFRLEGVRSKL
jgi:hypothetical protein